MTERILSSTIGATTTSENIISKNITEETSPTVAGTPWDPKTIEAIRQRHETDPDIRLHELFRSSPVLVHVTHMAAVCIVIVTPIIGCLVVCWLLEGIRKRRQKRAERKAVMERVVRLEARRIRRERQTRELRAEWTDQYVASLQAHNQTQSPPELEIGESSV